MALLDAPRSVPDGQFTRTVYGYIRDHEWSDAVELLQVQLQVSTVSFSAAQPVRGLAHAACCCCYRPGGGALLRTHPPRKRSQGAPDHRLGVLAVLAARHARCPCPMWWRPLAPGPALAQEHPDSRAALSLLGHCYFHISEYELAAQMCAARAVQGGGGPGYRWCAARSAWPATRQRSWPAAERCCLQH